MVRGRCCATAVLFTVGAATRRYRNDPGPESRDLSMEEVTIFEAARDAVATLKKTFEVWTVIGKAVVAARARADRVGGGKTFRRILQQQGLGALPPATATRLEQVIARLDEVTAWHSRLSEQKQIAWAAPTTVFKRCPVFAQERAANRPNMKPRRPSRGNIEIAIDTIVEGCAEMAMDERMTIVTRIADALGIATQTRKTRTKRQAKHPAFQQAEVPAAEWPQE
jgi:hypothetical protein